MGGGNSRPQFEERLNIITEGNPPRSPEFWVSLWITPVTNTDIWELLTPERLRKMRKERPKNLQMLLLHAVEQLRNRVAGETALFQCLSVVTRIMPFALEPEETGEYVFANNYLWPRTSTQEEIAAGASKRPLGEQLMRVLLDLMFAPGLTTSPVARLIDSDREVIPPATHAWAPGVGIASVEGVTPGGWAPVGSSASYSRRIAVLKAIIACCSGDLFLDPSQLASPRPAPQFLDLLTGATPAPLPHSAAFFYSLINIVCSYDPVGWGVPYNHLVSSEVPEELAQTCLQLLIVVLSWRHHEGIAAVGAAAPAADSSSHPNIFLGFVRKIKTQDQHRFVLNGISRIVNNSIDAVQTYLPFSKHGMSCFREAFALLWLIVLHNRDFVSFVMLHDDVSRLLTPLLYFIHEGRKNPAHSGLVHLCSLALLVLSEDREFGVSLNKPLVVRPPIPLPALPVSDVTLADFLVLTFHKIFAEGDVGDSLSECFLTVLANASPYVKALTMASASKLLNIFSRVAKPRFLAQAERNPLFVYLCLDVFNNAIQYEFEGNVPLIYTLLRCKSVFARLASITFEQFLAEATAKPEPSQQPQTPLPRRPVQPAPHFDPTREWFDAWKNQLPLGTILRMIAVLSPQIQAVCTGSAEDDAAILAFLKKTTLVGLLPVPHPIVMRKYSHNIATAHWFQTLVWSVIAVRIVPPPLFSGAAIRLFSFKLPRPQAQAQAQPQQPADDKGKAPATPTAASTAAAAPATAPVPAVASTEVAPTEPEAEEDEEEEEEEAEAAEEGAGEEGEGEAKAEGEEVTEEEAVEGEEEGAEGETGVAEGGGEGEEAGAEEEEEEEQPEEGTKEPAAAEKPVETTPATTADAPRDDEKK